MSSLRMGCQTPKGPKKCSYSEENLVVIKSNSKMNSNGEFQNKITFRKRCLINFL
jgi:hypothetical protein